MECHRDNLPVVSRTASKVSLVNVRDLEIERDELRKEVEQLKFNQNALMTQCRSLAQELEERDKIQTQPNYPVQETSMRNEHSDMFTRCHHLEKALADARQAARQMQMVSTEKSRTIDQLSEKLQSMQLSQHSSDPVQHKEGLDKLICAYKAKIAAAEEKQANAEIELGRVRQHYQALIENLQRQNENLLSDQDRIGVLQAQLKLYAEDFECERKDREAAQGRASELEQEVTVLRAQMQSFQQSSMARLHRNRTAALTNLQNEYQQRNRIQQSYDIAPYQEYRSRGPIECDSEDIPPANEDEDVIDSLSGARSTGHVVADGGEDENSESLLQCPKCGKGYTAQDHAKFLDHIDNCC